MLLELPICVKTLTAPLLQGREQSTVSPSPSLGIRVLHLPQIRCKPGLPQAASPQAGQTNLQRVVFAAFARGPVGGNSMSKPDAAGGVERVLRSTPFGGTTIRGASSPPPASPSFIANRIAGECLSPS